MRNTQRQTPAHATVRMLAVLLRRLRLARRARHLAEPRPDDADLAQRVRLSGEW